MICIRFIADHSFISRAIGFRTEGKPSHVEYVMVNDVTGQPVSTFGARLQGGITHRPYDYCKPSWEEWYTFPGIEASYEQAVSLEGRKYDWKDICALLFGWHPQGYDPMQGICSILVGYSNRMAWGAGLAPPLINPNVPTWEMTPELVYGAVTDIIRKVC